MLWGWETFLEEINTFLQSADKQYGTANKGFSLQYAIERMCLFILNVSSLRDYFQDSVINWRNSHSINRAHSDAQIHCYIVSIHNSFHTRNTYITLPFLFPSLKQVLSHTIGGSFPCFVLISIRTFLVNRVMYTKFSAPANFSELILQGFSTYASIITFDNSTRALELAEYFHL